jgi:hypothetical protein
MTKQKVPDAIQKLFNKIHYKLGDAVFFTWLGSKKYGYVIRIKEVAWGIQYTVESDDRRYPCGISIKTHTTTYTTGCIQHDDTRSIGQQDLIKRIQNEYTGAYTEISADTARPDCESRDPDTIIGDVSDTIGKTNTNSQPRIKSKNVVESGNTRMQPSNTKKRKVSELDDAIQRQRDFLNGFIKKD